MLTSIKFKLMFEKKNKFLVFNATVQLFLKKFHSLMRIQDQLIRIVYAYHYDTRRFYLYLNSELVYDTHIFTRLIWYTRVI